MANQNFAKTAGFRSVGHISVNFAIAHYLGKKKTAMGTRVFICCILNVFHQLYHQQ